MEYLQQGHVSEKTDTFALGVVLCELLTGDPPTNHESGEMLATTMYFEVLADAEAALPPRLDTQLGAGAGGDDSWPLDRAVALGRIARRCIEMQVSRRCVVADVLSELDALAGRMAVRRAGRGEEYDPMTGELVKTKKSKSR